MTKTTISPKGEILIPQALRERLNLTAATEVSPACSIDDVQGETLVMKRGAESYPDWRTMRGMARGGVSLTQALMEERAAELAHDDALAKGH